MLLSRLPFGALLTYSPKGTSPVSIRSRDYAYGLKGGLEPVLRAVVGRLVQDLDPAGLGAILGPDVVLVPVPRSSPLVQGALWPSRWIADALVAAGLGKSVVPCVERVSAVPKSASAPRGARPTAKTHYDTMRTVGLPLGGGRITVVDDIVTKGSTMLAAASRVVELAAGGDVRGFGMVRTMGLQPEVEHVLDPCVGEILLVGDVGDRQP